MLKDMQAIVDLAGIHQKELPVAAAALEIYRRAENARDCCDTT